MKSQKRVLSSPEGDENLKNKQKQRFKRHRSLSFSEKFDHSKSRKKRKSEDDPRKKPHFYFGGNESDPLNINSLIRKDEKKQKESISTKFDEPVKIPSFLRVDDPLNIHQLSKEGYFEHKKRKAKNVACESEQKYDPIVSPIFPSQSHKKYRRRKIIQANKTLTWPGPTAEGSERVKSSRVKKSYEYGNYKRYYKYRLTNFRDISNDPRIKLLPPAIFNGKKVLDIGCNEGLIPIYIAKHLNAYTVTGIDIDPELIDLAQKNVVNAVNQNNRLPKVHHEAMYTLRNFPLLSLDQAKPTFPYNIKLFVTNYVLECEELLHLQLPEYDVILCLSVTKWIHLNFGDEGVQRVFKRIFNQLNNDGIFILEAQDWRSYKKAKQKKLKNVVRLDTLNFRPDQFQDFLLSSVGFSYVKNLYPTNTSAGFNRVVQVYIKSLNPEKVLSELNFHDGVFSKFKGSEVGNDQSSTSVHNFLSDSAGISTKNYSQLDGVCFTHEV